MSDDSIRGLYSKYIVRRTDGSSGNDKKHQRCRYYVLDLAHDVYASAALNAYANVCEHKYPLLARDLRKLVLTAVLTKLDAEEKAR